MLKSQLFPRLLLLTGLAVLAPAGAASAQPGGPPVGTVAAQLEDFFVGIGTECTPKFKQLLSKRDKSATPPEIARVLSASPDVIGTKSARQYRSLPDYFGIVYGSDRNRILESGQSIASLFEPRDLVGVQNDLTPFGKREYDCASMMRIGSEAGIKFGVGDLEFAIERTTSANTLAFVVVGNIVSPLDSVLNRSSTVAPGVDQSLFRRQTLFRLWNWYLLPQNSALADAGNRNLLSVVTAFDGYAISKLTDVNGKLLLDVTGSLSVPLAPLRNSTEAQRHFEAEQVGRASVPQAGVVKPTSTGRLPGPSELRRVIAEEMKGKLDWKAQPEPVVEGVSSRRETVVLPGVPAELCRDDLWQLTGAPGTATSTTPATASVTGRQMRPVKAGNGCEVLIDFTVSASPAGVGQMSGQMLVPLRLIWSRTPGAADGLLLSQDLQVADYRAPASIEPTSGLPVSAEGQLDVGIRELPGWQVFGGTQPRLALNCKANEGPYAPVAVAPNDIKLVAVQQGPNGNKYFGLAFSRELFNRIRATPSCKIAGTIGFMASYPGRQPQQVSLAMPDTTFEALQPATPLVGR